MRRSAPALIAVALAAMVLLPGAASAKPGYLKIPASHILQLFPARGTHGYGVDVAVLDGRPQLTALRQSGAIVSVVYLRQTRQRDTGDDLDANFGKAGTLKARFVPEKTQELKAPKGCVGGPTIAEIGHFVGSLSFHGPHDFTSFKVHRLKGAVTRSPGLVCRLRPETGSSSSEVEGLLQAVAGVRSGDTSFDAVTSPADHGFAASSHYTASSEHRGGTIDILESVTVPSTAPLAIPDLTTALPATVTLEPPAPFSGSATIEAPSRATATLTGDLKVELPAAGEVPLTGPGITAGLCRDYTCTGSLPEALRPQRPKYGLGIGIGQVEYQTIH